MAGRKSDFTLTKLDDLFTTQAQREEEKLSKIRDIPLGLIDDFPDHPFKVRDDEDMLQLIESIRDRGVITPATVRQKEDGRYELISGHRRKRACELAGFQTLRCEVVDLSRDEATILMVESNFQRSQILPSEKAFTKTYNQLSGREIISTPKTPSSVRKVSMPAFLVDELKEYIGLLYEPKEDQRIFQISKSKINSNFHKLSDQAGLKRITIHGLRHSHVSLLISKKYDIFEVSKRIGHKSVKTTQDIYGHLFDDVQKSIANDLNMIRRGGV